MDFLKRFILQTQSHLKDLTLSQRLAIGSCVALIVVSLMWLAQWAAEPELVALLKQPISDQELAPIQQKLDSSGVKYKLSDGMLMVPADSRPRLLAQLSEVQALPKDISLGFNKIIEETSPWIGGPEQEWRRTVALGNELSKVLLCFEGIQEARVFIDRNTQRKVNGSSIVPTASVFVKLAPGLGLDKTRTYAIASLVSRAVAGLDITQVAVTDARTNRSMNVPARNDFTPDDDLEYRQKQEQYYAEQIQSALGIHGVLVVVHAELDHEAREETRTKWTKPVQTKDKSETKTQERGTQAGSPGVVANTARTVAAAGPTEHTETTSNEGSYETKVESLLTIKSPPRNVTNLTAAVNVPRSYLAEIFKKATGKDPSDIDLKTSAQDEIKKIMGLAHNALGLKPESGAVAVEWFHDEAVAPMGGVVEAGAGGTDFVGLARMYGGKASLGVLAVFSLFMMLMMVRKVSEGPVLPGEEPPKQIIRIVGSRGQKQQQATDINMEPETLTVGSPPIGEAEAREQLLVGKEVDETTLRVQQVVDQVTDLIRNDPETSAGILQRWIDAEKQ